MRDTMIYTTGEEIILAAELAEYDSPTLSLTDERFNELQRELQDPVYLEDVLQDLELQNAVQNFPLSEAVRVELQADLDRRAFTGNWSTREYSK